MGKYFTKKELTHTSVQSDNTPNEEQLKNLEQVIDVMDAVREEWTKVCEQNNWGNPAIKVNSGFRSKAVNNAVGGSKSSVHMLGYAVDFLPLNKRIKEFQLFMTTYLQDNNIGFDQFIIEYPINGIASWFHLGLYSNDGEQRKMIFALK